MAIDPTVFLFFTRFTIWTVGDMTPRLFVIIKQFELRLSLDTLISDYIELVKSSSLTTQEKIKLVLRLIYHIVKSCGNHHVYLLLDILTNEFCVSLVKEAVQYFASMLGDLYAAIVKFLFRGDDTNDDETGETVDAANVVETPALAPPSSD